jgi:hypothetical protein
MHWTLLIELNPWNEQTSASDQQCGSQHRQKFQLVCLTTATRQVLAHYAVWLFF